MKLKYLMQVCLFFILASCSSDTNYVVKVNFLKLKESDIYDENLVSDVIFDAEEMNIDSLKEKSRKLFLKGIDQYKNKKDPSKAASLFKKSILVFPDAKTYYELGNALYDNPNKNAYLEEAVKAYNVAQALNFQPASSIYYKRACAFNLIIHNPLYNNDNIDLYDVVNNLRMAFNNGFTDTLAIKNNIALKGITSTKEYKLLLAEVATSSTQEKGNGFFRQFSLSFPPLSKHFEIPMEKVNMEEYRESVNYEYAQFVPEMENVSFGRDVSHDFFYVAKVAETSNYTALIYTSVNYYGESMQPVHTTLATYDNQGEIISRKLISCQCSPEKIKRSVVDNNSILIQDYKREWMQPIDKVPFKENEVKNYELLAEAKYKIDDTGKIINDEVPTNYNDSTVVAIK